jgi:NAD(P)-dependent dehydrogenase (short-subunit alcohol dehydrogenase family)
VSFTHATEERPFAGKVALVTGAARPRGIGRATALGLARGGADVACLDIARRYDEAPVHETGTADDLATLADEVRAEGVRCATVAADVSDEAAVEAAVARVSDELGTVTVVANVAGGSGPGFGLGPLLAVPDAEFRRVLDVNVVGTWLVSKACAARMVAAGVGGRICNVSSQAGKRAFPFLGAYWSARARSTPTSSTRTPCSRRSWAAPRAWPRTSAARSRSAACRTPTRSRPPSAGCSPTAHGA